MLRRRKSNSRRHRNLRDFPAHRQFVRRFCCQACGSPGDAMNPIICAHVDYAGTGPERKMMGGKVPDWLTISLCDRCHKRQHNIGWKAFEQEYGINAEKIAEDLTKRSPKAREMREAREQLMEKV